MNNKPLNSLPLLNISLPQIRTFHITWVTFFMCFFGWFGLAPLMPTIREDLGLTKAQVGNSIIAAVSATIFARLLIGYLVDKWGPRKTYTALLVFCSIPVMTIGLAHDYTSFILFRLAIGVIGASFVITQYHTAVMFAPNVKGTANAIAGGWGNLGGGITNMAMPLIFAGIVALGYAPSSAWRIAMVIPGILLLFCAYLYYFHTQDTPEGDFVSKVENKENSKIKRLEVLKDKRVWILSVTYAVCFGMEITFDNIAALHFVDNFGMSQKSAGFVAGIFGFMNIFARALGGILADKMGLKLGMKGKALTLASFIMIQGIGLVWFGIADNVQMAIIAMLFFALFLKMANGATYAITPFINTKNAGLVAGIVGAGGNIGGMAMGFLFKFEHITYATAFGYVGIIAVVVAAFLFFIKFENSQKTVLIPKPEFEPLYVNNER